MSRWMPSVLRFIRRFLMIVSLMCLVAVVVLWVRSRFALDAMTLQWGRHTDDHWRSVEVNLSSSASGCAAYLEIQNMTNPGLARSYRNMPVGPAVLFSSSPPGRAWLCVPPRWWNRLRFFHEQGSTGPLWHMVAFPHWFLLPFFAAMPLLSVLRARTRRRRVREGLCVNCGYDLRASPERCPECGLVPSPWQRSPRTRGGWKGRVRVESSGPRESNIRGSTEVQELRPSP
jgi:hypothetical protein